MNRFHKLFNKHSCSIIGMIHVGALPGTPKHSKPIQHLIDKACTEAEVYRKTGIDAVLVENMHDVPYIQPKDMGPEIVATMTRICSEVRKTLPDTIHCGIQILAGANREAIAVALGANLQFVRAEGYVFSHMADEGFTDACAGPLKRYQKSIGADDVLIFADIKKKHSSHAITSDISLEDTAKAAEFFLTDGVIITGNATGDPANPKHLKELKSNITIPVLVGSGVTKGNLEDYIMANAIIIGTHFKEHERWENDVSERKVMAFLEKLHGICGNQ